MRRGLINTIARSMWLARAAVQETPLQKDTPQAYTCTSTSPVAWPFIQGNVPSKAPCFGSMQCVYEARHQSTKISGHCRRSYSSTNHPVTRSASIFKRCLNIRLLIPSAVSVVATAFYLRRPRTRCWQWRPIAPNPRALTPRSGRPFAKTGDR